MAAGDEAAVVPMSREVFWALASVNMVVAVDVLGLLLILPIVDTLAQKLGASKGMVGTLFTAYSTLAILSSFVMGKISDLYGRRTIFILSACGSLTCSVAVIFVTNFTELLIATALSGCFTGTVSTAYAYVADLVQDPKRRGKYISYTTATLACCLVLGPLTGGLASVLYLRAPFYISASLALLELVLVWLFLKNPSELQRPEDAALAGASPQAPITSLEEEHQSMFLGQNVSSSGAEMESLVSAVSAPSEITTNPLQGLDGYDVNSEHGPLLPDSETTQSLLAPGNVVTDADDDPEGAERSAWTDYRALLVGGLGVFLNTCTYLGMVALVPLLLQEPSFGIVDDDEQGDDLSDGDISRINFLMGTYLGVYGLVQVVFILLVFPKVQRRLGMLPTGALGCLLYGVFFCLVPFVHHTGALYAIFAGMAVGNAFSRPTFPAYLSSIAHPQRRAEYMSVNPTCGNVAMVFAGQLTLLFSYSSNAAVLLAGLLSVANAVMLVAFAFAHRPSR